jgi:TolB-like protein
MDEPSLRAPLSEPPLADRLDSWKEIAAHLHCDVTTVQRWEKREGMPVHRHQHDKRGSVYAFSSEVDAWMKSRRARLEEEEEEEKEAEAKALAEAGGGATGASAESSSRHRWVGLGGIVLLGLIAAAYVLSLRHNTQTASPKITSLAVLPLKNLSGDPAQEYFADGMTEAVIAKLCMIRGLRVISRTSVMQFKDKQTSIPEIAKALHVDALVEGSVIRQGERVRITVQLIRGGDRRALLVRNLRPRIARHACAPE